jgi:hypothetical protein
MCFLVCFSFLLPLACSRMDVVVQLQSGTRRCSNDGSSAKEQQSCAERQPVSGRDLSRDVQRLLLDDKRGRGSGRAGVQRPRGQGKKISSRNRFASCVISQPLFQVIPRYNVRGRNRSSSAKYTNNTSLLPTAGVAVRSNSFRVNRNTSSNNNPRDAAGTVTPEFCKHIKYCCLHQNANSARLDSDTIDRPSRNQEFSDGRMPSLGTKFKFNDLNASTYSNFSDDEKSMKFNRKFSTDASASSIHNKSLPPTYDGFENRKCNCGKLMCKCLRASRAFLFAFFPPLFSLE